MVLPKSTVHVSRLAGTALKSFTHGYAQTVVAASQSSYASQNTPVAPLASNFLSRFKEKPKSNQHAHFSTVASQSAEDGAAVKTSDSGLAHYQEAWQKHQKSEAREWHHLALAKRVGWKPPTTIPEPHTQAQISEVEAQAAEEADERSNLKRSYSTSAVDNFAKAIDNVEAEAAAFAQVNESITGERVKRDSPFEAAEDHGALEIATLKSAKQSTDALAVAKSDFYTTQIEQLRQDGHYTRIPALFESMLRDGVSKPSQQAYRALLISAVELTESKHQKVPRVLDIYADMMRRGVVPDSETLSIIVDILATRALDAAQCSRALLEKSTRLGAEASAFTLDQLEYQMMSEDQTLGIALKFIGNASTPLDLPSAAYEALITACAIRGQTPDMVQLYNAIRSQGIVVKTAVYPAMIKAFGESGDLRNAVSSYDDYRDMAIANNAGKNTMHRIDQDVYTALVQAYGQAGRLHQGRKLLARVEAEETATNSAHMSLGAVVTQAVLPLELRSGNFKAVYAIVNDLSAKHYPRALETIAIQTADSGNVIESVKAFDALAEINADISKSALAIFALHVRNNDVEGGERFWAIVEQAPATLEAVQLSVLRAKSLLSAGQMMRGLRPARTMLTKYRSLFDRNSPESHEASERIEEAIEVMAKAVFNGASPTAAPEASAELLRMMNENATLSAAHAEPILATLGPSQIANMAPADLDIFTQVQARLLLEGSGCDIAGPARFGCMLENVVARSVLPDVATQTLIEQALAAISNAELSQLWNGYRYPIAPRYSPVNSFQNYSPVSPPQTVYDDSFDPYIASTDHKGSVIITDILEKSNARPAAVLGEALTKFRNIRRAGRHPRFFAYGKLIQAAAKANQLQNAQEVLEMAKQDVPLLPQYRIVRHGWIAILDSMVSACITTGRRDLAARYHQDLLDMGAAPSANTFGLYITSLKETTKTFDEASEAVKIFLRSKAEGVEPTSFLYNALIGKLGKARRIDDCLFYFAEMRNLGIRPTSVTYGTIVNALCRVSDEKFAEEIFEEMEASNNYKPRPAPYHSLMQYFLTTKRDRSKVLSYYERMRKLQIEPTAHTFKLLIDAHATIEPIDMSAAEAVLGQMQQVNLQPEAVHYASLIHAKGCVKHDMEGARALFDQVLTDPRIRLQPCIYQALFESLVANHLVAESDALLADMSKRRVELTPYIVNALIHGWTLEKNLAKAQEAFRRIDLNHREPSTYEAMVRAHLAVEDHAGAESVVAEALSRGYPSAVAGKIAELVGGGRA
ncbi:PPR repeat-containing protein 2 [Elsinoe australis]|uniref:PPR repeat-containing protein 2 n=1 Tax=Elsinoe australis TaxID=40998 RepID=A0A4U7AVV8_9PEZI|nr:PPR repeat-containing protein 2 [Elsinoe australis]